jgi:DNA replication protein DnaC
VKALANESHRRIEVREGDYKKDGVWYCGQCHTPKQYNKQAGDIFINAMCLCKCQKEEYEREEKYFREKMRRKELDRKALACFPVAEMKDWTFDRDDNARQQVTGICKSYCENFSRALKDGTGLLFYGNVGTGKSFLAACIANWLLEEGYSVIFDNARGYADMAFDDKEEFLETISNSDLLILDDLGMERPTEYMKETVFQILDKRSQVRKPIIVTTNMTNEQLKSPRGVYEERIFSRLLESTFPILMKGEDRRRNQGKEMTKEWREILLGREKNVCEVNRSE